MTLERAVLDLGLEDHVEFDDRFLSIEEIADLLAATDVFVTPYRRRSRSRPARSPSRSPPAAGWSRRRTGTRRTCSSSGAGTIVPFADAAALADAVCRYIEEPAALCRRPRRSPAHRRAARLAVGRSRDRGRPARGGRARTTPAPIGLAPRPTARQHAHRSPAHARRRRRDHPARERRDPEPSERLLRRRRRPPRGRRARARPPRRRAGLDVDRLSVARVPPGRDRRRRGPAELHGLRPALARRAASRRPRRTLDLGARRDPLHRLGPRRRRADRAAARHDRSHDSRRSVACGQAPTLRSVSRASIRTGSIRRLAACWSGCSSSWQRPTPTPRRRAGSGSRTGSPTTTRVSHTR